MQASQASGASKGGGPVQANRTVKVLNLSWLSLRLGTLVGHLNKIWSVNLRGTLVSHRLSVM